MKNLKKEKKVEKNINFQNTEKPRYKNLEGTGYYKGGNYNGVSIYSKTSLIRNLKVNEKLRI